MLRVTNSRVPSAAGASCRSPRWSRTGQGGPHFASGTSVGRAVRTRAWRRNSPPSHCRSSRLGSPSRLPCPPPVTGDRTQGLCTAHPDRSGGRHPHPVVVARVPCRRLRSPTPCVDARPLPSRRSAQRAPAAIHIEDHGEVKETHPRRHIGDVRHPQLIRGNGGEVPFDEVGRRCGIRPATGGARPFAPMAPLKPRDPEQTRYPFAGAIHPFTAQLGPDTGHPVGSPTARVDDVNPPAQRMVGM